MVVPLGCALNQGEVVAEHVVIAAGMWSRQIGAKVGLNLPLQAAEHYYFITGAIDGIDRDLPLLEDIHNWSYYREEVGGLLVGLFEPNAAPWMIYAIPDTFSFGEIEPDWERMAPHLEAALRRVPIAAEAGVRKFFCGPESFTPDLAPLVGEAPGLRNCWVAAGLNSLGILYGPGIGRTLAHWIVDGRCPVDHTAFNVDRFADGTHNTPAFRRARTPELLAKSFGAHFPNDSFKTARGLKRSALHDRLKAAGAYFSESHDWELPDWFAPTPEESKIEAYSWGRQNWFDWHAAEHRAARKDAILMDMSSMSKFLVQGRDACALLIGRDALVGIKAAGTPRRRMLQFLLSDPEPLMHGKELIHLDGQPVGYIQVGAYGHTLGGAVGIGFAETDDPLTAERVSSGDWFIEVVGQRFRARASLKPLFDPEMKRVKALGRLASPIPVIAILFAPNLPLRLSQNARTSGSVPGGQCRDGHC